MRLALVMAGLAALAVAAGPACDARAQPEAKKRHKSVQAPAQHPAAARTSPRPDGYAEREANKLPFGSAQWWDQMMRENRAGQCCN